MYHNDLDLITKARLERTQDVALAQRRRPSPLDHWLQRTLNRLTQRRHPH